MKTATVKEIKTELTHRSTQELIELCLRLSRFKKENKELLTYLLFESTHEEGYIESIKNEVICKNTEITKILEFTPLTYSEAIILAQNIVLHRIV